MSAPNSQPCLGLRARLLAGFLLIEAITVVVGLFAMSQLCQVNQYGHAVAAVSLPRVSLLGGRTEIMATMNSLDTAFIELAGGRWLALNSNELRHELAAAPARPKSAEPLPSAWRRAEDLRPRRAERV